MTKEEAIKEAYGKDYELLKGNINKDGWHITNKYSYEEDFEGELADERLSSRVDIDREHDDGAFFMRPKSLRGLLNNNGWTKTEDQFPPQEEGMFYGYHKDWEHPDFTPDGVREFYIAGNKVEYEVYSFKWCGDQDEYNSVEGELPTHWKIKEEHPKPIW